MRTFFKTLTSNWPVVAAYKELLKKFLGWLTGNMNPV